MRLLQKSDWKFFACNCAECAAQAGHVIVSLHVKDDGYRSFMKLKLSELPQDLIAADDLKGRATRAARTA